MTFLVVGHLAVALLVAAVGGRVGPRVFLLAALAPLVAFGYLTSRGPALAEAAATRTWPWAPALGLQIQLRVDTLSLVLAVLITGIGAATLVYSRWYFAERREGLGRIAAVLLVFAAAMLGVAFADNLLLLYVAWELTTVCSFLLIGDDGRSAESRAAALRALLVTTGAGFPMLLGFLVLGHQAGTFRISALVADPPDGPLVQAALVLVLVGAFAKSAQVPFHPWLPAAMLAPAPVSAYLHAAAMVKAGIYLVARLTPAFAAVVPWQALIVTVGLATLVLGGWRALAQTDLKRLLAYGTIAQLGLLIALLGAGTRTAALAGLTLVVAHALFKGCLFFVVGIIDHAAGTRDLAELSGVARRSPVLLLTAVLACASMVGLPPFLGYLGKEAALEAFHTHAWGGRWAIAAVVIGSVLTVAYTCRFLWGAFAGAGEPAHWRPPPAGLVTVPAVLGGAGLAAGLVPTRVDHLVAPYADSLADPGKTYHLALWHGFSIVVVLSVLTLLGGVAVFAAQSWLDPVRGRLAGPVRARAVQDVIAGAAISFSGLVVTRGHARALPAQLRRTLLAVVLLPAVLLVPLGVVMPHAWGNPWQTVVAAGAVACCVAVAVLRRHLMAAVVLGMAGYLIAVVFALHGAPDLALTQLLVETLTFVVFVLVLRRRPHARLAEEEPGGPTRIAVALCFGATMALSTLAMAARHAPPRASPAYLEEAPAHGGPNVVNVILTEYRALDTLGEITVLVIAATAVAGLVLTRTRMGGPPRPEEPSSAAREEEATRD